MPPDPSSREARLGLLAVAASALLFSCKAIFIKLGYRHGVEPTVLMALRMLFSLPFFLALAAAPRFRGGPRPPPFAPRDFLAFGGLGFLGYYLASLLDLVGLQYVSAAQERLVLYVYPTLVLLFSAWFFGKPLGRGLLAPLALTYAGVAASFGGEALRGGGQRPAYGSFLIFLSAVAYAFFLILQGRLVGRIGAQRLTAWSMLAATAFILVQFAALHPPGDLLQPGAVYLLAALVAVLSTVLPAVLLGYGIARVGARRTAVVSSVGPAATLVLGGAFLEEAVGPLQVLGLALVLGGTLLLGLRPPAVSPAAAGAPAAAEAPGKAG